MKLFLKIISFVLLVSCTTKEKNIFKISILDSGEVLIPKEIHQSSSIITNQKESIIYKNRTYNSIEGDFLGNSKRQVIRDVLYSGSLKQEIDLVLSPLDYSWDDVIDWYIGQDLSVIIKDDLNRLPELNLGNRSQGLYCLINIGDNNNDGKDEIALVLDLLDHSNINSCRIYSICNNEWTQLKNFDVNESSFSYVGNQTNIRIYSWLFRA